MKPALARSVAVVALTAAALLAAAPAAVAAEKISSFQAEIRIDPDGILDVTETIVYDFGATERHGIFRDIRTRLAFDTTFDRTYPITVTSVDVIDGPSQYEVLEVEGGITRIKIGDPDTTITGSHAYTIRYRLEGALNGFR